MQTNWRVVLFVFPGMIDCCKGQIIVDSPIRQNRVNGEELRHAEKSRLSHYIFYYIFGFF